MNRRSFMSMFGAASASVIVKPKYFLAPMGGWVTPQIKLLQRAGGTVFTSGYDASKYSYLVASIDGTAFSYFFDPYAIPLKMASLRFQQLLRQRDKVTANYLGIDRCTSDLVCKYFENSSISID